MNWLLILMHATAHYCKTVSVLSHYCAVVCVKFSIFLVAILNFKNGVAHGKPCPFFKWRESRKKGKKRTVSETSSGDNDYDLESDLDELSMNYFSSDESETEIDKNLNSAPV